MSRRLYPVIMCGGAGTRLWPLSRESRPKQFQKLVSRRTMLEETLLRLDHDAATADRAAPVIICNADHEGDVQAVCENAGVTPSAIILEPAGRNTAPVAAIAALHVKQQDPEGLVLLLPADHDIRHADIFWQAIKAGLSAAGEGYLTTLGIPPASPETGYGYIRCGEEISATVARVRQFTEKPDLETAKTFCANGHYFWNAGIFLFRAQTMLEALQAHAPDILESCEKAWSASQATDITIPLHRELFSSCRSQSIDYAVMEKTDRAAVIAAGAIGWSDIGSWDAVAEQRQAETSNDHTILIDSSNMTVVSEGPVVAAIGVEDLIIVATGDAVLVTRKGHSQDVKAVIEELKQRGKDQYL